ALDQLLECEREPLSDAWNLRDRSRGIAHKIRDAFGISFDGGAAVAIAADAEAVLAGDLHEVGGLPEQARDFFVLQPDSLVQLYRVASHPFVRGERRIHVKLRALTVFFFSISAASAQSTPFNVVSAASYQNTISPDSIATIFGTNLARSTASASLDANGQLPTELASTRVEVNGQTAALFYVSPSQINFVVPAGIASGANTVLLRSTDTNTTRSASVQIAATAPALFSSDASGRGPGAILNGVT